MGLGKTAQAIACCDILWRTGRIRRGLIIAPASLKPQWAREWARLLRPADPGRRRLARRTPGRLRQAQRWVSSSSTTSNCSATSRSSARWDPDLVVLDEAQRIKNWATKTALSVKGLTPPYRLVLTGTPMENRIEELASIVEWVDDMALEPKWRLERAARDPRRRPPRGRRRPQPRHDPRPAPALHGPAGPPGRARPASRRGPTPACRSR